MTHKYECDCGARYDTANGVHMCQVANHGMPRETPMATSFFTQETDEGMVLTLYDSRLKEIAKCLVRRDDFPHFAALFTDTQGKRE